MTEVKFLEHVISQEGILINPAKIDAIYWEKLKNMIEIHSFLDIVGYYHDFGENFSRIAIPLTSFMKLKQRLANAPVLTMPNSQDL